MEQITCKVIEDMLPLYIDGVESEDTRALVEAHLSGCERCAHRCEQMKQAIETDIRSAAAEAEKQALLKANQRIRRRKRLIAALSVIAGAVVIAVIVAAMNLIKIPVAYDAANFKLSVREAEVEEGGAKEDCLFLNYTGKMYAYEQIEAYDGEQLIHYVEIFNTPWSLLFGGDDQTKHEILLTTIRLGDQEIGAVRYITGDIRPFYDAGHRNDEALEKDSLLLWDNGHTVSDDLY